MLRLPTLIVSLISTTFLLIIFGGAYEQYRSASTIDIPPTVSASESEKCAPKPRFRFFMYHYIRNHEPDDTLLAQELSVSPLQFDRQLAKVEELAEKGLITLHTPESLLEGIRKQCFSRSENWLFTADDGWSDSASDLAPIAVRHRVPFTLGIITHRLGTPGFLTEEAVKKLSKNPYITIASHSVTHRDHSRLTPQEERSEACQSRTYLEELIQKPVQSYIYPSGEMNARVSEEALRECGYEIAWTTHIGNELHLGDPWLYSLNRIRITQSTDPNELEKLIETPQKKE